MSTTLIASQLLNGLAVGMLYAVLAFGLSIIKGLLNVPNFAHGALYAIGAYVFASVFSVAGEFWISVVVATIAAAAIGAAIELGLVRPLYKVGFVSQLLALFGIALVLDELIIVIWGPVGQSLSPPGYLRGALELGPILYPKYMIFVMLLSAVVITAVWALIERTRFGAVIRAGIERPEMVRALGINIQWVFVLTFALGAGMAGFAGAVSAPIFGISATMGTDMLATAFVVVVLGGLGSIYGSLLAGLLVGVLQSMTALFEPGASTIVIYIAMALILLFRPQGLLGER